MNDVVLNVLDANRALHWCTRETDAMRVVASLAADPATLDELDVALQRFIPVNGQDTNFSGWEPGTSTGRPGTFVLTIDLAHRLVFGKLPSGPITHRGVVQRDDDFPRLPPLAYNLATDWQITAEAPHSTKTDAQAANISGSGKAGTVNQPLAERDVLYDRLPEYLTDQVALHQSKLAELDRLGRHELCRGIHQQWLLTERNDLQGRSPRDVLLDSRHEHIDADLQNQRQFWAAVGDPPPTLPVESVAYRCGGFGTHEIVLYYDLVRHLLQRTIDLALEFPGDLNRQVDALRRAMQDWLHDPNHSDLSGSTPAAVIDRERRRLPETVSDAGEHDHEDDCLICQMMGESHTHDGPVFWHLDGCNMDDDFAFSFHTQKEDWENEQYEYESWSHKFDLQSQSEPPSIAAGANADQPLGDRDSLGTGTSSYVNMELIRDLPPGQSLQVIVIVIAGQLSEILESLKGSNNERQLAKSLRSYFTDLRRALDDQNAWLINSTVVDIECELQDVMGMRSDLTIKCGEVQMMLNELLDCLRQNSHAG